MKSSELVLNDLLGYEGLKIYQRPDMFNFSLDSTILAYFIKINKSCKKIIDLGCGNGYIPIFLTLRTKAHIDGVDIQEEACELAKKSVEINKLESQISIYHQDLKTIHETLGVATYDVVTCNPPYFIYKEDSFINESIYKVIARHEIKVKLDDVVKEANILLKEGGTFGLVHRVERMLDILETLRKYNFEAKRIIYIYPKTNSPEALGIYIESITSKRRGGLKILPPLYVYDENNNYTKDILKIFNYKEKKNE